MKRFSIAIPCYEMHGKGGEFLDFSFKKLVEQTFNDFDVVIADHSVDKKIESTCFKWRNQLDIKYYKNESGRGYGSANTNFSIEKSTGQYIKLLCQDDYFFNQYSLSAIDNVLRSSPETEWMATGYVHTRDRNEYSNYHVPSLNTNIHKDNTIGTPSCIIIRNDPNIPKIDETLKYYYDCDLYKQLSDKFSNFYPIETITVVNYLWNGSVTSSMTSGIIRAEYEYMMNKYENAR